MLLLTMKEQSLSIKRIFQFGIHNISSNPLYLLYLAPAILLVFFYAGTFFSEIQLSNCPGESIFPYGFDAGPNRPVPTVFDQLMHPVVYHCKEAFFSLFTNPENLFFGILNVGIL